MSLLGAVHDFASHHGYERTFWIAYSGGLDSHVLLSLCHQLRKSIPIKLRAIHINHNLSPNAEVWAQHCRQVCSGLEIEFVEQIIHLDLSVGDSLEEVAREKRYAIFAECLKSGDMLLTAHQEDDQAETVLLQLFRGAGLKGLSAMPVIKPFARGFHGRPLLSYPRATLQAYAQEHQLQWIDDESNYDTKLTRNYLRHEIIGLLKKRWPTITKTISRSAAHCAEAQSLLDEFATSECKMMRGSKLGTLSVSKLLALDSGRQKMMLRTWIKQMGYPVPDVRKIESIRHDVLHAEWDRLPCVTWQDTELRRYRDELFLMAPLPDHDKQATFDWDLAEQLMIPGVGTLSANLVNSHGLHAGIKMVSVRFRRGGEDVNLPGRGHHTLKNLLQERGVLPWQRDRIPLLYLDDKLIAAVGLFVDPEVAARNSQPAWDISLT